ncbi:MAG: hypothetical protein AAB654_06100 [Acidobacteriota bacterium]
MIKHRALALSLLGLVGLAACTGTTDVGSGVTVTNAAPAPGPAVEWRMLTTLMSGNAQTCFKSADAVVRETKGAWSLRYDGMNMGWIEIPLKPDGSSTHEARARWNIPPGTGPRPATVLMLKANCGYKLEPK